MPEEKSPMSKTADELDKTQRENVPAHMFAMVCDAVSDFPICAPATQRGRAQRYRFRFSPDC